MYPQIFRIPFLNIPIYGYGLMMVVAFLATQWMSSRLAKRLGHDPEIFVNLTLFALVFGVIGSRLSHVLENLPEYTRSDLSVWQNLWNMVNIRSGGLTFYGGVILAFPVCALYIFYKKVPVRVAMDICAPCLMLGLGIGRVGCFLNGCCYGAGTDLPWAVRFPYYSNAYVDQFYASNGEHLNHPVPRELLVSSENGVRLKSPQEIAGDPELVALAKTEKANPVHPAELYSTLTSLLIMGIVLTYFTLPHSPGRAFALVLMIEGPSRFLLEMLRVEPPIWGPLSLSMILGIALFFVGLGMWIAFRPTAKKVPRFSQATPA